MGRDCVQTVGLVELADDREDRVLPVQQHREPTIHRRLDHAVVTENNEIQRHSRAGRLPKPAIPACPARRSKGACAQCRIWRSTGACLLSL